MIDALTQFRKLMRHAGRRVTNNDRVGAIAEGSSRIDQRSLC